MLLSSGVLLFLWPHKRKPAGAGKKKEKPRGVPDSASVKDGLFSLKHGFEEELKRLRAELEKTNDDYQLLHDEMEKELNVKRRQEEEFKKEIQRLKGWGDKEKSELDKLRKENNSLQSAFADAERRRKGIFFQSGPAPRTPGERETYPGFFPQEQGTLREIKGHGKQGSRFEEDIRGTGKSVVGTAQARCGERMDI
jgi:hypothetical protein